MNEIEHNFSVFIDELNSMYFTNWRIVSSDWESDDQDFWVITTTPIELDRDNVAYLSLLHQKMAQYPMMYERNLASMVMEMVDNDIFDIVYNLFLELPYAVEDVSVEDGTGNLQWYFLIDDE